MRIANYVENACRSTSSVSSMVNKRQRHARSRHAPLHLATSPANDICQRAEHFIGISSTGEADSLPRSSNVMLQQCSAREAASCNYLFRPTAATRARTVSRPLQLRRCTSVQVSNLVCTPNGGPIIIFCQTAPRRCDRDEIADELGKLFRDTDYRHAWNHTIQSPSMPYNHKWTW